MQDECGPRRTRRWTSMRPHLRTGKERPITPGATVPGLRTSYLLRRRCGWPGPVKAHQQRAPQRAINTLERRPRAAHLSLGENGCRP
jgi:hypothetical protein